MTALDEARQTVEEGLALVERTSERFHESNLHRLQGEILLLDSASNQAAAIAEFEQATEIARQQKAGSWELRAAMSHAKVVNQQGNRSQAAGLLQKVFASFTEGFNTPDLVEARSLLKEWGHESL